MSNIITTKTRRLYLRPPQGDAYALNKGSILAKGLLAWWPIVTLQDHGHLKKYSLTNVGSTVVDSPNMGRVRQFVSASTQYCQYSGAVVSAVPFSMSCWFRITDLTVSQEFIDIGQVGTDTDEVRIGFGQAGDDVNARSRAASVNGTATATGVVVSGEWTLGTGVWRASNSRSAYRNGRNKVTDTTNLTPTGLDTTRIGQQARATPTNPMNGMLADPAIWDRALSDAEVYMLWDPLTRWDLYYPLGRKIVVEVPSATASTGLLLRRRRMIAA